MTKQQLSVLLAKLQEDSAFRDKLQSAADLDSLLAMARNAGFEINSVDIRNLLEKVPLGDEDLSEVSGGLSMRDYQDMMETARREKDEQTLQDMRSILDGIADANKILAGWIYDNLRL